MKYRILFLILLPLYAGMQAQLPIEYHLTLDQIQHHELGINIVFPALPDQPLTLRMPVASPGRYAAHNFAKNVYEVRAVDQKGKSLEVSRIDISTWEVAGHQGYVKVYYTLYGNHGDGTYTGIDSRKLHMNMPATFMYGVGLENRPVRLSIDLRDHPDWQVATQLKILDATTFEAPDYYYFYDSPTMVGDIDFRRWTSDSNGKTYTIEVAMMHEGTAEELDEYAEMVKQVVETQKAVYGSLPDFDYGRYTFLCSYNPYIFGDGMEHRNSTVCSARASLASAASRLIGTISHEFFHCWNVERIRPASLEPFDFDQPNMSDALWFAEGFTSYYDDLSLCRAGILSPQQYISSLRGTLNYVYNHPGRALRGPIEMSHQAPFVDAATSIDEVNRANTFISYYSYGAVLGLVLDLTLRNRFSGIALDDFMRYMWQYYGQPEIPYQIPDLQHALASVTQDSAFAADFFSQYIYGHDLPDLVSLMAPLGVEVALMNPGKSDLEGLSLRKEDEGWLISSPVTRNHSLYEAGINAGDHLLSIDGKSFSSEAEFLQLVSGLAVGKEYAVTFLQLGIERTEAFTLLPDPSMTLQWLSQVSDEAEAKRSDWLQR